MDKKENSEACPKCGKDLLSTRPPGWYSTKRRWICVKCNYVKREVEKS